MQEHGSKCLHKVLCRPRCVDWRFCLLLESFLIPVSKATELTILFVVHGSEGNVKLVLSLQIYCPRSLVFTFGLQLQV